MTEVKKVEISINELSELEVDRITLADTRLLFGSILISIFKQSLKDNSIIMDSDKMVPILLDSFRYAGVQNGDVDQYQYDFKT